jgi:succinoglycan biosynthesis transport protein ExoP
MTDVATGQSGLMAPVRRYWHVLLKWKWTALIFAGVVLFAAIIYSLTAAPVYTAKGRVWIEDKSMKIVPGEEVQTYNPTTYVQTHAKLLQSRALATETIDRLKLADSPQLLGVSKPKAGSGSADLVFREKMIASFIGSVVVTPVSATRLVDVSFKGPSPKFVSETLNALLDGYIAMIVRQRYQASAQASEFLTSQITQVRNQIEQGEAELNKYGSERDILPLTAAETPTVTRIADYNKSLTEAQIDRINKYNYYNQIKDAALGEIPGTAANPLIQSLRQQYASLSSEYARKLPTIQPDYPDMQRLKSQIDAVRGELEKETQNVIRAAYSDYQAALSKEQSLAGLLQQQKDLAYKANSNSIVYNSLKIELENKKTLLESLLKRQNETDVSSRLTGLEGANVWIVDRADFPLRPTFPDKRRLVLIGLLIGILGGLGLSVLFEYLSDAVKTSKDIATHTGLPTLGSVPSFETGSDKHTPMTELNRLVTLARGQSRTDGTDPAASNTGTGLLARLTGKVRKEAPTPKPGDEGKKNAIELIASREPQSIQAENFRSIRTTLLVSSPPGKVKSILFTSPLAREGKSSTASNLAITLAQAGKRVVIVDSDLRRPKLGRIFDNVKGKGLTHYLSSDIDRMEVIRPTPYQNLFLVNSGPVPANPIELLTSEKMDDFVAFLKRSFDYVLFDAPPVLVVSDAVAMATMIDGIVLVVRGGQTPVHALKQAKLKLDAHKLKCLGVILNGVDLVEQDGYYASQYHKYYQS